MIKIGNTVTDTETTKKAFNIILESVRLDMESCAASSVIVENRVNPTGRQYIFKFIFKGDPTIKDMPQLLMQLVERQLKGIKPENEVIN